MKDLINSKQIQDQLSTYLVGQEEYIRQLAILGFKHQLNQMLIEDGKTPINNNLLVVGPTGSGKTFGAKQLAKILDIPFFEVDCSNIVQTGYKGNTSVENILMDAFRRLRYNVEKCIIYLDEFDKIYDQALDVRGEGTAQQQNFLKMLEPNEAIVERENGSRNSSSRTIKTGGITFIATGSFDFIRRKNKAKTNKIGLNQNSEDKREITKDDIIQAGFIPELVGRFATLINLNDLTEDDYYRILLKSKESAYTAYQNFFDAVGVDMKIDKAVFKKIAAEASMKSVGARGINDVLNSYLEECVFAVSCDDTIRAIRLKLDKEAIVPEYTRGERISLSDRNIRVHAMYSDEASELN